MFCAKWAGKIKGLLKKVDKYVQENATLALRVTTAVKAFLDGPIAKLMTAVIPTDVDEMIRQQLIVALSKAIDVLSIVDACKDVVDLDQKLICFITEVKKKSPELQEALLVKMAQIITREIDGNKLPQSVYDLAVQGQYTIAK